MKIAAGCPTLFREGAGDTLSALTPCMPCYCQKRHETDGHVPVSRLICSLILICFLKLCTTHAYTTPTKFTMHSLVFCMISTSQYSLSCQGTKAVLVQTGVDTVTKLLIVMTILSASYKNLTSKCFMTGCEAKVAWQLRRAFKAEHCINSFPLSVETLADALHAFQQDICPGNNVGEAAAFMFLNLFESLSRHQDPWISGAPWVQNVHLSTTKV